MFSIIFVPILPNCNFNFDYYNCALYEYFALSGCHTIAKLSLMLIEYYIGDISEASLLYFSMHKYNQLY
jgi:hypothetical protein